MVTKTSNLSPAAAQFVVNAGSVAQTSQNCDILPWRFNVYVGPGGKSDVQSAIDRLSDRTAARLAAIIRHLSPEPRDGWHRPQAAKLVGFEDLFELRFKDGDTPCRPTGFFGPGPGTFTITLFVTKNRNGYHPPRAFEIADRRRVDVATGKAWTAPLEIDGEVFPPTSDEG